MVSITDAREETEEKKRKKKERSSKMLNVKAEI